MEAARLSFGLRTLLPAHKIPVCHVTKLFLFPRRSVLTQSWKPTHKDSFFVRATNESSTDDLESTRPLMHYSPSLWGDHFLSLRVNDSEFEALEREIELVLKPTVKDMVMSSHSSDKEKMRLIHLLTSLGISYYFETEIKEFLNEAFAKLDSLISEEDDLETISIMFEVFRLYGYKMSCDAFDIFKGEDGKFRENLVRDVRGMLQLYEAAHLQAPFEDKMDEAVSFTRYHLESFSVQEADNTPHLSRHIQNSLYRPRIQNVEILIAREYISFYNQEEGHNKTLLKFASLNFNYCQLHYIKELKYLTRWWKDLGLVSKLPYIRDRIVETYFSALALYFEPRYSLGRIIAAKIIMIVVILDDTCDAYGTFPEVQILVDALQRWDLATIDEVPGYLRIVVQSILETLKDIEGEMKPRGRSRSVQVIVDEIKSLARAYLEISRWARAGHVPSFEDYMEVGLITGGMDDYAAYGFIAMEDCDENSYSEWFHSNPKIFQALNAIYRMVNDISTFEQEISRGEVANGVNCYMKQHGLTKTAAVREINKMIRDQYKVVMEEFMTTTNVPWPVLVRCLNISRSINVFYNECDEFASPHGKLKDFINSLFIDPIGI